jgi:hypothetical protein
MKETNVVPYTLACLPHSLEDDDDSSLSTSTPWPASPLLNRLATTYSTLSRNLVPTPPPCYATLSVKRI